MQKEGRKEEKSRVKKEQIQKEGREEEKSKIKKEQTIFMTVEK